MRHFTFLLLFVFTTTIAYTQATFNWVSQEISDGNNLQGMTVAEDGSAILIGYDNTFKKSSDMGQTWANIGALDAEFDFIGMSSAGDVAFVSSRRSRVIDYPSSGKPDVYVSGVILMTNDKGATWTVLDGENIGTGDDVTQNPNAEGCYAMDIYSVGALNADTILAYVGWYDNSTGEKESRSAIFRTNDGGGSWSAITPDLGNSFVTSIQVVDGVALIGGNKVLLKADLSGETVDDLYPSMAVGTDSSMYLSSITAVSADEFYAATTSDGVFKTEDGGATFTIFDGIGGGNDVCVVNDSTLIVLGSSSKSMVSTDSGVTWTDCYPGSTCYKIGGIFNGTLYGLSKSDAYTIAVSDLVEKNITWGSVALSDGENLQKMAIFDDNTAVIAGYAETCMVTTDGGATWSAATLPDDFMEDIEFDFNCISSNGDDAYAVVRRFKIANYPSDYALPDFYMEGLVLSTNDNWETSEVLDISKIGINDGDDATKNPQLDGCYGLNPYTIECVDANTAYVYANWYETVTTGDQESHGRIFKTTNAGDDWTAITEDLGNSYINGIQFNGDLGYISGNKVLYKTVDGGATLTDLYPNVVAVNDGDESIFLKDIVMASDNEFYIPSTSDGIFVTTDGGATFTKLNGISGTNDFYKFDSNSFIALGSTTKSFFTNDGAETWQNASTGTTIWSIGEVLGDSLYALAKSDVYKIALSDLDLGTGIISPVLANNIEVRYQADGIVVLSEKPIDNYRVYSITGQMKSTASPGTTRVKLTNSSFTPGVYILTTSSGGKLFTNKVVFK